MKVFVGFSTQPKKAVTQDELVLLLQNLDVKSHLSFRFNSEKQCLFADGFSNEDYEKVSRTYHGSKWKGGVLRVEPAQPHYLERLKKEQSDVASVSQNNSAVSNKNHARRLKRLIRSSRISVDNDIASPVSDINWFKRKASGWKLVSMGGVKRPVLVVSLKMNPTSKKPTKIDPSKFPNKFMKLYPKAVDPSVLELEWPGIEHNPRKPLYPVKKQRISAMSDGEDDDIGETLPARKTARSSDGDQKQSRESEWSKNEIMPPKSSKKWMPSFLSSDDESDDNNQDMNGDKEDIVKPEDLIVPESLTEERESSMSILRGMLGMATPTEESRALHAPVFWKDILRFDPDSFGADSLLRHNDIDDGTADDERGDTGVHSDTMDVDVIEKEEIPSGIMDSTAQGGSYVVTTDLRSLVFGTVDETQSAGSLFSWLGDQPADQEPSGPGMLGDSIRERVGGVIKSTEKFSLLQALGIDDTPATIDSDPTVKTDSAGGLKRPTNSAAVNFGSTALFFFHFDNLEYHSRTLFHNDLSFMRTATVESISQEWEENKLHVTQDFKKKHKSATRRRSRTVRSIKGR
ncbi:hypothetical protein BDR26DRAFT_852637 [Obelidium mucronatum]|nr:hypothetical protein BDR26DRAFT_852637 [Obelidium mucronatum]